MIELKAKIDAMNIFQLQEIDRHTKGRMSAFGVRPPPALTPASGRAAFKHGDLIEFNTKAGVPIRAKVERLNDKTIGCRDVVTKMKWRVGYGLAHLVGADKPSAPAAAPAWPFVPHEPSTGAMPTGPGGGSW